MNKIQEGKTRLPVLLETENACSADGFSPIASFYLPPLLTLSAFSFFFLCNFWSQEDDEEVGLLGISFDSGFFLCLQGRKQWQNHYSSLCCPLIFPSLSVFYFVWFVLSVWVLFFSGFPFFSLLLFLPPVFPFVSSLLLSCSLAFIARENNAVSANHKVW